MINTQIITWYCVDRSLEEMAAKFFPEVTKREAVEALKHELLENDQLRNSLIVSTERRLQAHA